MIYLLHFSEPLGDPGRPRMSAQHYVGFARDERDVAARLAEHRAGRGARITAAVVARGGSLRLARRLPGTRADERRIKRRGHFARYCPICAGAGVYTWRSGCE